MSKSIRNTIITLVIFLLVMSMYHLSTQVKLSPMNKERMISIHHISNNLLILYFIIKEAFNIQRIVYYKWIVSTLGAICLYSIFKTIINLAYMFEGLIVVMDSIDKDLYAIGLVGVIISIVAFVKFKIK